MRAKTIFRVFFPGKDLLQNIKYDGCETIHSRMEQVKFVGDRC